MTGELRVSRHAESRESHEVAGSSMPITLHHERDNVFRMETRGTLRKSDFEGYLHWAVSEIERLGTVRLLWILEEFEGWDPHDHYDLSFYMKYGDAVDRIAVVCAERWRELAMMFVSADLRKGLVMHFPEGALAEARAWLYQ
jgi:SpoIIAA-like